MFCSIYFVFCFLDGSSSLSFPFLLIREAMGEGGVSGI